MDYSTWNFPVLHYWSLLKLFIESMMPPNHLILCWHLLLCSVFPSIRVFSNESALCIRWPKHWIFSISACIENSELISFRFDWFDLLQIKGLPKTFSSTRVQKNQSVLRLPCGPNLTSVHDHRKNHSFGYMDLCWQSDVSVF